MDDPPLVFSISYGAYEDGFTESYMAQFNAEAMKAGVQGGEHLCLLVSFFCMVLFGTHQCLIQCDTEKTAEIYVACSMNSLYILFLSVPSDHNGVERGQRRPGVQRQGQLRRLRLLPAVPSLLPVHYRSRGHHGTSFLSSSIGICADFNFTVSGPAKRHGRGGV